MNASCELKLRCFDVLFGVMMPFYASHENVYSD